ncbi:glutamyl-tRNA reductase [Actinacidiphila sp. ITFR-21]|uniref:glutamyl-tRNA reductase n=1 Tax=Actinacidiphila sp. ITFR-21 TaxID=3075199 RepID=UPI00288BE4AE|nr:glutamyl-tRNA reductase [Streptomyces sp. ITFR-21]WNI14296.1 glutamyl-tRNA reductase [Streptomyces sp. ITFR-21]
MTSAKGAPGVPESSGPGVMVVGISHASAPLDLLERLSETGRPIDELVAGATTVDGIDAAVVLSTCNRLEIYTEARPGASDGELHDLVARHTGVARDELDPHFYTHRADDAVRHLFTVVSGLDSVVVGEDQILGQVKQGLERSQKLDLTGKVLAKAVQTALRVGKQARNDTGLNEAGRSLATEGLAFFERRIGSLTGRTALVIGAGSMAGVVVAALRRSGLGTVHLANRTPEKAQRLAETAGGRGYPLERVPELLAEVDVVVGATGTNGHVVTAQHVEEAMRRRRGRELFILDLALPHNISPDAAVLPGVTFVDLKRIAEEGSQDEVSVASVRAAHDLVDKEVADFRTRVSLAGAAPILTAMRNAATEAADAELGRLTRRVAGIDGAAQQEIDRSVRRIIDKALHRPTLLIKELATSPDGARHIEALSRLFAADGDTKKIEVIG